MMFTRSLRWRIQIWHGLLLVAVLAGFGWTSYRLARDSRQHRTDEELQRRLLAIAEQRRPRRDGPPPGPPGRNEGPPVLTDDEITGAYAVTWRRDGFLAAHSPGAPTEIPMVTREEADRRPPMRQRGEFREFFRVTPFGDVFLVGRSVAADAAELNRLAWLLSGAGAAVLVLGLGGGWWLASRAIAPVVAISETAGRISAGHLGERIDVTETDSELGHLAGILNATFARLEEAFSRQAQFTADAAHELRTPVSIVISQAQLGLRGERTAPEYREMLDACLRAARRMQGLIESLLELARLDGSAVELQRHPCDLASIARDCVDLLRPAAAERRVALQLELAAAPCEADPDRVAQVVTNLVANALEHTPEGGGIVVRTVANGAGAALSVSDTGSGIPAEHLPRLFDRFYRADTSRTRRTGGAGLGLAICKSITDAHGGSLEVKSEPGHGSTFTFRLASAAVS